MTQTEAIITVGVSEALYLTMTALLNPGEEVIIPTPCFVSYQAEVIWPEACQWKSPPTWRMASRCYLKNWSSHHSTHEGHLARLPE